MNNLLKIMCISVMLSSTAFGAFGNYIMDEQCALKNENCS